MDKYQVLRAIAEGKKPFVVLYPKDTDGTDIFRYALHTSLEGCRGRFRGWKVEETTFEKFANWYLKVHNENMA